MGELLSGIPRIDGLLGAAVLVSALAAWATRRRGGQFRGLPGWSLFWILFAALLILLSRSHRWLALPLLAGFMFAALRAYFTIAPVRYRDRLVVLIAYVTIPFALWPTFIGSTELFFATIPVTLFLVVPVFLALGGGGEGLLDAMGRTLLGVTLFVFCLAHLGLLMHVPHSGLPQLFGILVLGAELPRRIAGPLTRGPGWLRPAVGFAVAAVLATGLGFWLGPDCGLVEEDGGRAGFLVFLAVTLGARVSSAVTQEISPTTAAARAIGRIAILNRMVPTVYAAPVFFHYLDHFA